MEYYISGALLRLFETVVSASLWIVIGCFIAAIFQRLLGAEKVKQIFGDDTRFGLLLGWLIGMLLPVCSLGVIPIVRELHRCGVKRGTIVAFGLTAPLFNPMSVLYGLTLSDPIAILSFSLCALIIVSCVGFAWNRIVQQSEVSSQKMDAPVVGLKRSIAIFYSAGRQLVSPTLIYIGLGILASVSLAVFLPHGYLQNHVNHDNTFAPISVAFIATPIYSTPLLAMSQIGGMFQHGNSVGAAFSLLILGAGANIGLLAWMARTYGWGRFLTFYLLLAATTIGLAFVINKPLYPKGVDPAGHTHAFDVYTHPFNKNLSPSQFYPSAKKKAADYWEDNEFGGTTLLIALLLIGVCAAEANRFFDVEAWFAKQPEAKDTSMDIVLPPWVLGVVSVVGLVTASVVGCYLYYPPAGELFADLKVINTEVVLSGKNAKWEAAEKWIRYADDLSRRLEVGVFLRNGSVGEFQSAKAYNYRDKLDGLNDAVQQRDAAQAKEMAGEVYDSYNRMREAFLGKKT